MLPALFKPRPCSHAPRAAFRSTPIFLTRVTSGVRVASCSAECSSGGQDELPVQRQELRKARAEVAQAPGTHCYQLTPPGSRENPSCDLGRDLGEVRAREP